MSWWWWWCPTQSQLYSRYNTTPQLPMNSHERIGRPLVGSSWRGDREGKWWSSGLFTTGGQRDPQIFLVLPCGLTWHAEKYPSIEGAGKDQEQRDCWYVLQRGKVVRGAHYTTALRIQLETAVARVWNPLELTTKKGPIKRCEMYWHPARGE